MHAPRPAHTARARRRWGSGVALAAVVLASVLGGCAVLDEQQRKLGLAVLGIELFDRAREPRRFMLVDGGTHHSTNAVGQAQYRDVVAELFGLPAVRRGPPHRDWGGQRHPP